ncbi:MAG: hypothetical protein B6A08_02610 [Sorangiineae bacterium NIC37A_2]|nr:MAG: hypothetical protein B6A08_02610 [Sorangiineae bacterium NIC37A_2]
MMETTIDRETLEQKSLEVLAKHAKSFRWASLFLPQRARRDAAVLYAFCRRVDDIVDEGKSREEAARELDAVEAELRSSAPTDPLVARFRRLALGRGFGLRPALDLIAGMRGDLGRVRVRSAEELELYCYRVAGTVGLMMTRTLGAHQPEAQHYAVSLGMAMQLTNICRDVAEDARRDRVYLPASELRRQGLGPNSIFILLQGESDGGGSARLADVVRSLLSRAEDLYSFASHGFRLLPFRARLAVVTAALLYRRIGHELLDKQRGNPLLGRAVVSPFTKVRLVAEALGRVLFSRLVLRGPSFALSPAPPPLAAQLDPYFRLPLS